MSSTQLPPEPARAHSSNRSSVEAGVNEVRPVASGHRASRAPKLALQLLAVAVLSWLACAFYTLRLNPELTFFSRIARNKQAWARKMTQEHENKTIFFGGSSCTFSVRPKRLLEQHTMPAVNLGLGAGLGVRVLTRFALEQVRPGDTLVMAMEPGLLLNPMNETMLGSQFSLALGRSGWLSENNEPAAGTSPVLLIRAGLMLRPGGYHFFTLLGKLLSGKPLYRYHVNEVDEAGWEQTPVLREPEVSMGGPASMPPDVRAYLTWLRGWCDGHRVRLACSLPWLYTDEAHAAQLRRTHLQLLSQLAPIMPVLKEGHVGVDTNKTDFADTGWHLRPEAATARTDELARALKAWDVWSVEELTTAAAQ